MADRERELRVAWRTHGPELYAVAVRRLGDRQLAEEVVADTFARAWRAGGHDPGRGSLRTFLFAILRNGIVDAVRHRAARPVDPVADPPAVVEADASRTIEQRLQLREALRQLSDAHHTVIVECHLRDRPYEEVAAELDVPVATLRTRMYYGLRALRLALEEQGWSDGR